MPTKNNIELGSGKIYFNNEPISIVDECVLEYEEYDSHEVYKNIEKLSKPVEIEIKNVKVNSNILLSLLHGRNVTNNWLKMHGGIMSKRIRKECR